MVQVPNGTAVRVLWGMWLLAALIVGSVYRSNLKAMLILPKLRLPFDNLQELTQTDIPCVVPAGSALMHIILVQPNFCFFFFLFFFSWSSSKRRRRKKNQWWLPVLTTRISVFGICLLFLSRVPHPVRNCTICTDNLVYQNILRRRYRESWTANTQSSAANIY